MPENPKITFRVWCLSWEDAEEQGTDIVGVGPDEFALGRSRRIIRVLRHGLNAATAAEEYADWAHNNRGGYEDTWPLLFRVRCPDGATVDFEVEREISPTFRAVPSTAAPTTAPEAP